ncbi:MAG TPA: response regulator transcription factor, partial [Candidatus Aminicenantes bacterium]|nr:response regulator transcription factor [Candidatus Aminicenantes bacterium]
MDRILVVEDDKAILMSLQDDLRFEGYEVATASDGKDGLRQALGGGFDLVILDILLPGLNGFEVCKKLREAGVKTPILMVTAAKTEEMDKVVGLELGADDYVTKPVGSRELVARVKAILRRAGKEDDPEDIFAFGDVKVDFKSREVFKGGREAALTALEFNLLRVLIKRRGRVVTRDEILDEAWGEAIVAHRTIDPHIAHLRKKLEDDPARPAHIL